MAYQHTLTTGTVLNGEYRIQRVLGSGGFANTYLATDLSLRREVAIKEYFPSDISVRTEASTVRVKAPTYEEHFKWGLDRFVREAKTLAKFRHPNIVRVFRTFDANDTAYTVLDFVKGADMSQWLRTLGRPPTQAEFDAILGPILEALELVHDAGILHRDIKPANIYIRSEDGQPVLLDFGAARYAVGELTGTTAAIVSRGYSPHEAYATDNKLQGPWTDIYGLAASVYRGLAGEEPVESTMRVLEDTLTPATQLRIPGQSYRESFLESIDWGLSVLPNNRPGNVGEWRTELFSQEGGMISPSTPVSRPRRGAGGRGPASGSPSSRRSAPRSGGPSTGRRSGAPSSSSHWGPPPGASQPRSAGVSGRPRSERTTQASQAKSKKSGKSAIFAAVAITLAGLAGIGTWQSGLLDRGTVDVASTTTSSTGSSDGGSTTTLGPSTGNAPAASTRIIDDQREADRRREEQRRAEAAREAEAARKAEAARQAEAARKAAERERQAEADRLARIAEQRRKEREEAERKEREAKEAAERQRVAMLQRQKREAEEAARKKREAEAAARRQAAEEAKRKEERRRLQEENRRRIAEEAKQRAERQRLARLRIEEEQKAAREARERAARLASPEPAQRVTWVKEIQRGLGENRCYRGAIDGNLKTTQKGLTNLEKALKTKDSVNYKPIELASANVGEYEDFLGWFRSLRNYRCEIFRAPESRNAKRKKVRPTRNPRRKEITKRRSKPKTRAKKRTYRKKKKYTKRRTYKKKKKKRVYKKPRRTKKRRASKPKAKPRYRRTGSPRTGVRRSPARPSRTGGAR